MKQAVTRIYVAIFGSNRGNISEVRPVGQGSTASTMQPLTQSQLSSVSGGAPRGTW